MNFKTYTHQTRLQNVALTLGLALITACNLNPKALVGGDSNEPESQSSLPSMDTICSYQTLKLDIGDPACSDVQLRYIAAGGTNHLFISTESLQGASPKVKAVYRDLFKNSLDLECTFIRRQTLGSEFLDDFECKAKNGTGSFGPFDTSDAAQSIFRIDEVSVEAGSCKPILFRNTFLGQETCSQDQAAKYRMRLPATVWFGGRAIENFIGKLTKE